MKILLLLLHSLFCIGAFAQPVVRFAAMGDYGKASTNELNVSNLIKSWNPEFIITMGDNNYELGSAATIDTNIGKYYNEFIYPYIGSYGAGDTVNRFFPSLGNHDWYTAGAFPYLNYFSLPGNERYYDFIKGNIHFYAVDSDPNEPDGVDSNSVQGLWLKNALANSKQKWNIVYFHHAPYSSAQHGSQAYMQWPFKKWGASVVMAGHDHTYERILIDSLLYIVNGLGGKSIYSFNTAIPGSQLRYNNNYGAMLIQSYDDSLALRFYSISGNMRDHYKLLPAQKRLSLKSLVQGFYYPLQDSVIVDTLKVYLRNVNSPYELVDSAISVNDSDGMAVFRFAAVENATPYFVVVSHRNSIDTWSSASHVFTADNMYFDLTSSSSNAYGNNLISVDNSPERYALYGGDVDRNGNVDGTDLALIENDAAIYATGYVNTDLTGDNIVDGTDSLIAENNSANYVSIVQP